MVRLAMGWGHVIGDAMIPLVPNKVRFPGFEIKVEITFFEIPIFEILVFDVKPSYLYLRPKHS